MVIFDVAPPSPTEEFQTSGGFIYLGFGVVLVIAVIVAIVLKKRKKDKNEKNK